MHRRLPEKSTDKFAGAIAAASINTASPTATEPQQLSHASQLPAFLPEIELITIEEVCTIFGLRKSAVYERIKAGQIHKPIKLGEGRRSPARWFKHLIVARVMELAQKQGVL